MNHEAALLQVNQLQQGLSRTARSIANALGDGKITPIEGMMLSMNGLTFVSQVLLIFQATDPATRADMLFVLEHGEWTLPVGS